jgi:hypothetical protein
MSNAASQPAGRSDKSIAVAVAAVLAIFAVALLVRLPFVANPLLGEEGAFGRLVLGAKPVAWTVARGFPEMLAGQLNGVELFGPFQRNIMIYLTLDYPARWIGNLFWPANGSFDSITLNARLSYLLVFCCGIWVLGFAIVRFAGRGGVIAVAAGSLVALYALTSPLLVGASLQPQIDGSVGILFLGVAAFLLLKGDLARRGWVYYAAAGVVVGIGRPEWLMAMTGAAIAVGLVGSFAALLAAIDRFTFRPAALRHLFAMLSFCAGLLGGVLISIAVSSFDFMAGFDVLDRVVAATGGSSTVLVEFRSFWLPIAIMAAAALAIAAAAFVTSARRDLPPPGAGLLIALIGGIAITIGFALSGWGSDGFPRYFAPALLLVTVSAISLLASELPRWLSAARAAVFVVGALAGIAFNASALSDSYQRGVSISSYRGYELKRARERMETSAKVARENKLIPLEFSSFGLYFPGVDFVSQDLGVEGAKVLIRAQAGGREDALYQPK